MYKRAELDLGSTILIFLLFFFGNISFDEQKRLTCMLGKIIVKSSRLNKLCFYLDNNSSLVHLANIDINSMIRKIFFRKFNVNITEGNRFQKVGNFVWI